MKICIKFDRNVSKTLRVSNNGIVLTILSINFKIFII